MPPRAVSKRKAESQVPYWRSDCSSHTDTSLQDGPAAKKARRGKENQPVQRKPKVKSAAALLVDEEEEEGEISEYLESHEEEEEEEFFGAEEEEEEEAEDEYGEEGAEEPDAVNPQANKAVQRKAAGRVEQARKVAGVRRPAPNKKGLAALARSGRGRHPKPKEKKVLVRLFLPDNPSMIWSCGKHATMTLSSSLGPDQFS